MPPKIITSDGCLFGSRPRRWTRCTLWCRHLFLPWIAASVPFAGRYVLSTYVLSWFEKEWTLEHYRTCEFMAGECRPAQLVITWQDSALVFGIGTAAVLALAALAMRRRDIT